MCIYTYYGFKITTEMPRMVIKEEEFYFMEKMKFHSILLTGLVCLNAVTSIKTLTVKLVFIMSNVGDHIIIQKYKHKIYIIAMVKIYTFFSSFKRYKLSLEMMTVEIGFV